MTTVAVDPSIVLAALRLVDANQVVWHSSVHDDGSGFALVYGGISHPLRRAFEQLLADGGIRVSDPAMVGHTVVIEESGQELLLELTTAQVIPLPAPRRPLDAHVEAVAA